MKALERFSNYREQCQERRLDKIAHCIAASLPKQINTSPNGHCTYSIWKLPPNREPLAHVKDMDRRVQAIHAQSIGEVATVDPHLTQKLSTDADTFVVGEWERVKPTLTIAYRAI